MTIKIREINEIQLESLESLCDCSLFNYGTMRDLCNKYSCKLVKGKTYGIIGEFGAGGWALSYTLAGKENDYDGIIRINGQVVNSQILRKISCYVGEDPIPKSLFNNKKRLIINRLKDGIKLGKSPIDDIEEIIQVFGLSHERLNRIIENISNERWRASMAIGYTWGKKIYCFPWLNTGNLIFLKDYILPCITYLKQKGSIIIIPTCKIDIIKDIIDEAFFIKSHFEESYNSMESNED